MTAQFKFKGGSHIVHSLPFHNHGLNPYNHFKIPFETIKQIRKEHNHGTQPMQITKKYD